ncbi:hypothetical protein BC829DRAFT_397658 [Chytridium lagenaria]|nr:hypothetical protein BC829DRAFT_397658 [Chytridium lagenaria]
MEDILLICFEQLDAASLKSVEFSCRSWNIIGNYLLIMAKTQYLHYSGTRTTTFSSTLSPTSPTHLWKRQYLHRLQEFRRIITSIQHSLLYNLHLNACLLGPDGFVEWCEEERERRWRKITVNRGRTRKFYCNISSQVLAGAGWHMEFVYAKRFLIHQIYVQLEINESHKVPHVTRIFPTAHPCIVKVVLSHHPRSTYLCFTDTMEMVDRQQEGVVDRAYRRLLECNEVGEPRSVVPRFVGDGVRDEWRRHQIALEKVLIKVETQLLHFPNGINHKLRESDRMELARRYVFLNSKYNVTDDDSENAPIHPFLNPLEQVSNIVPPPVYNSSEVFLVHCALGYTRLLVLKETGQVIHSFDTSRSLWTHLLRFGATGDLPSSTPRSTRRAMATPILVD